MELVDRLYKQLELLSQHKDFNESCTIIDILDTINKIKELEAKLAECRCKNLTQDEAIKNANAIAQEMYSNNSKKEHQ